MKNHASSIASKAITAHMHGGDFQFKNNTIYEIGIYSKKLNLLYGKELKDIDFKKSLYKKENSIYIIDRSAQLHLGIKYIVLKDSSVFNTIENLKKRVMVYTILAMIFISIIGYILSRFFLKPITNERKRLDRFIKDTTHELNTPISALLMSTSSLKCENSKTLQRINISAKRISNIYNDLCYILKEDQQQIEDIEEIEIKTQIEEQITLLEGYAKSKKIDFKTDLESFKYNIDKESVIRLINNIITNAIKYSKPNTTINISLKNNQLQVKDNGIGIKRSELNNIKKRYYRANDSEGGFGIGLDIVNLICKKYNIKFTINSKEDIGTTVILKF